MARLAIPVALLAAALLVPLAAGAEPVCKADAQKLCPGIPAGGGRLLVCLGEHELQLSDPCKRRVVRLREDVEEGAKACHADIAKYCKGVAPGAGRIAACLEGHEADLTSACKEAGEKGAARGKKLVEACKLDAKKLCAGTAPGGGRIALCLAEHEDELSATCAAAIDGD